VLDTNRRRGKVTSKLQGSFLENLVIFTGTERVFKAQLAVLEFLLINHPLDCPVCDQEESVICRI